MSAIKCLCDEANVVYFFSHMDLSIVMPCLNEGDTLLSCINKCKSELTRTGILGEIIVADNGSTDGSLEIAEKAGCRVVNVTQKGYGNALMGGIQAAKGSYVIMGDADDSYDFSEIGKFYEKLSEGYDLVQGCRMPSGGGQIAKGAMPFSHRWIGNPLFSFLSRVWFNVPIHDIYCGMRGFRKEFWLTLDQRCTGMEFATEMIIKSSLVNAKFAEVPITLHKDGRIAHAPHLKTIRDGWRTLRFFLALSPRWLYLIPGALLFISGISASLAGGLGIRLNGIVFEAHTLLYGCLSILAGWQTILLGVAAKTFVVNEKIIPCDNGYLRWGRWFSLERGLTLGSLLLAAGGIILAGLFLDWRATGYGTLQYATTMRLAIPGSCLILIGIQTIFSSFILSLMHLNRR